MPAISKTKIMENNQKSFDLEKIRKLLLSIALLLMVLILGIVVIKEIPGIFEIKDETITVILGEPKPLEEVQEQLERDVDQLEADDIEKINSALEVQKRQIDQEIDLVEKFLVEVEFSEHLYNQYDSLLLLQKKAKNEALSLQKKLQVFNQLERSNQIELLSQVLSFIGKVADAPIPESQSYWEKVLSETIEEVKKFRNSWLHALADKEHLQADVLSLREENQALHQQLAEERESYQNQYYELINKIDALDLALSRASQKNEELIAEKRVFEEMIDGINDSWKATKEELNRQSDRLNRTVPIRLSALSFTPYRSGSREVVKNSRGEFLLWQIEKMRLSFQLEQNLPESELKETEKFDIIIKISQPHHRSRLKFRKERIHKEYRYSMPAAVPFNNLYEVGIDGKKGKGMYSVEIWIQSPDGLKLLGVASFFTRKFLDGKV